MKELSIEEKAQRYDEILARAKGASIQYYKEDIMSKVKEFVGYLLPELKESEDDKISKEIIDFINRVYERQALIITDEERDSWIAWLEKQREQKPADNVEPKFHEGDWVVEPREGEPNGLWHIERIEDNHYWEGNTGVRIEHADKYYHHWTIQDVQDGDVLVCEGKHGQEIGIVKKYVGKYGGCDICFETYCFVDWDGIFRVGEYMGSRNIHPATKEQRDTLMKAMADAGYTFDFEKKELKEIDNEIEIPFGAKDSELQEVTYYIPKGFHAEINDDKVVIKKCEKTSEWSEEDEKILNSLISSLARISASTRTDSTSINYTFSKEIDWLKSLKERYTWKPSDEQRRACKEVYADLLSAKGFDLGTVNSELNRLEEQLKKLRENSYETA